MKTLISTYILTLLTSFAFASSDNKQLEISLTSPVQTFDKTVINFNPGIVSSVTTVEDIHKVFSTLFNTPSIYTLSFENEALSGNDFSDLSISENIPVSLRTSVAGEYVFAASLLTNFDPTTIIRLEDKETQVLTDLRAGNYAVQLLANAQISDRFVLHVSKAVLVSTITADYMNTGGSVVVLQDNSVTATSSKLFDVSGNLIGSYENTTGNYSFDNLASGDYILFLTFGTYIVSRDINVGKTFATGINKVSADKIKVSADSKTIRVVISDEVKQDGTIRIYNLLGQSLSTQPVTELTSSIAMNQQPSGYYIVAVQNDHKTFTSKVFIGE